MKGKATRTSSLRLVPSQFTERIQAQEPPTRYDVWQGESVVDRVTIWYANVAPRYLAAIIGIMLCAIALGFLCAL